MNSIEERRTFSSMSTPVLVALVVTLALSGWALYSRPRQPAVIGATSRPGREAPPPNTREGAREVPLPDQWPSSSMDLATDDPFREDVPKAAPAAAPAQMVSAPMPAPVPAMDLRFWGRFAGPDGEIQTFVVRGAESPIRATPGVDLGGGWQVEHVTEGAIEVVHPSSASHAQIAIPVPLPTN